MKVYIRKTIDPNWSIVSKEEAEQDDWASTVLKAGADNIKLRDVPSELFQEFKEAEGRFFAAHCKLVEYWEGE